MNWSCFNYVLWRKWQKITTIENKPLKEKIQFWKHLLNSTWKNQFKIIFTRKIVCPKLDEIAKDQNLESGIEDSDVEKEEDEKDSVKGNDEKNNEEK